ncbi:MAG: sigma-70 family RNA polymerase sigma factor [Brevinematales bacterium]|nr:sigma-70 family RNA polymerase sigma factor [Brevinematales bacterium]
MALVDENRVKSLISEYQNGNQSVMNAIIREISLYVYNFPIVLYNSSRDDASDFYIYFMERVESVVAKFKDKGCKFVTYLTASLINYYKNFLAGKRRTLKIVYESELNDVNIFSVLSSDNLSFDDSLISIAVEFFESLDEFSKLIIKTFIFELTPEDIKLISKYTNKPVEQVLSEYQDILKKVFKKCELRKKLIQLINKKPTENRIERLKKMNILCGYSDVAKLLGMTVSNVGISLKRLRDRFKNYAYKNLSTL